MEVPYQELDPETLQRVLEAVVLREGTDYGEMELSLEEKTQRLYEALAKGDAVLHFDEATASVSVLPRAFPAF